MSKKKDWTIWFGKEINYMYISGWLDETKTNGSDYVICQCLLCGNCFIARIDEIARNLQPACCEACSYKIRGMNSRQDEVKPGDRFGKLVVKYLFIKNNNSWAHCVCECGKETNVRCINLTKSGTHQCHDCANRERNAKKVKDARPNIGDRFGFLEVLGPAPSKNHKSYSRCLCHNCSSICEIANVYLKNGDTKSCGCMNSWLEAQVKILLKQKYPFFIHDREYDENLVGPGGGMLRPDFVLYKVNSDMKNKLDVVCWIECQGKQHYYDNDDKFGKEQREITDLLKKEYCKQNNIPFYEIRFDEDVETRVDEILDELKRKEIIPYGT